MSVHSGLDPARHAAWTCAIEMAMSGGKLAPAIARRVVEDILAGTVLDTQAVGLAVALEVRAKPAETLAQLASAASATGPLAATGFSTALLAPLTLSVASDAMHCAALVTAGAGVQTLVVGGDGLQRFAAQLDFAAQPEIPPSVPGRDHFVALVPDSGPLAALRRLASLLPLETCYSRMHTLLAARMATTALVECVAADEARHLSLATALLGAPAVSVIDSADEVPPRPTAARDVIKATLTGVRTQLREPVLARAAMALALAHGAAGQRISPTRAYELAVDSLDSGHALQSVRRV
jgi:anthranilate phosphoribosyltransferase